MADQQRQQRDDDRQAIISIPAGSGRQGFAEVDEKEQRKWKKIIMAVVVLLVIGVLVLLIVSTTTKIEAPRGLRIIHFPSSPARQNSYKTAAAAVDATTCSTIAKDIMEKSGGNAVDAAIAATICDSVFNMYCSGIGGGFMMTIWNQTEQKAYTLNARETAPLASSKDMYDSDPEQSEIGALSIGVPGESAGYWTAHQNFGKLPWQSLFEPTISICRKGFEVSNALALGIANLAKRVAKTNQNPNQFARLLRYLTNSQTGAFYAEGDTMKCSQLADTLERISKLQNGHDFYDGDLATDILADLAEFGAIINETDLANYEAVLDTKIVDMPIQDTTRQLRLVSTRPPGSGAVMGLIMNIMAGYKLDWDASQDLLTYHRFVEAFKFAYGQRMLLGDEAFEPNVTSVVEDLTSIEFADYIRAKINDQETQPTANYMPDMSDVDSSHGTVHLSIVDGEGNAVSMTSTTNSQFGSGIMGSRTGIVFNNQMDDFSKPDVPNYYNLAPSPRNYIEPGKRPLSSTCPAIILIGDDKGQYKVLHVIGGSGGSRITSGTAYVATRMLWFDETPKEAVDALRLHHQLLPEVLKYETGMPDIILRNLRQKGHVNQTEHAGDSMSAVQMVYVAADGTKYPFSDYRKQSLADGY